MQALLEHLERRRADFLADLATLVNLDCGTDDKAGVDAAGAIMRARLERAGFAVEVLPVERYGDCLLARRAGRGAGSIFLLGHLDTVYPRGTAAARPMTVDGGRIRGPGANDMKAGLLAGVYAVEALAALGRDDYETVTFFCNAEEEVGSPVSRHLYADAARQADAAFVLEAARADGSIVSARKAGAHFIVTVTGRAAHAGVEPEKGANAIHQLAHHIQALAALNGLRPGTTVSVGLVSGGTRSNVVPDKAEAHVDVRVVEADDMPIVDAAVRAVVAATTVPGTATNLGGSFGARPMAKTAAVAHLVDLARGVAAELGIDLRDVATGGISDANKIAALGTPVLDGLGPVGGLDHSPDEYVDVVSIGPRTALLAGLIRAAAHDHQALRRLAARER